MPTVADKISEVKGKATSYKTAYLKTQENRGWIYYVLGYSKSTGICTVLVKSPFCVEFGSCYYQEIAHLPVDESFQVTPAEKVRVSLRR